MDEREKELEKRELWKKLNEVANRLQLVSEQLIEASVTNRHDRVIIAEMKVKVDLLEQQNFKYQGSLNTFKWLTGFLGFVFSGLLAYGTWLNVNVNDLSKSLAVLNNKVEIIEKNRGAPNHD